LIDVSKHFYDHLKSLSGTKNVGTSSADTPGQFVIALQKDLLANYGIPASLIYGQIAQNMNGIMVGTVEDNGSDMDVKVKTDTFLS
jgi:multidrug efflux pump subunit AcrB